LEKEKNYFREIRAKKVRSKMGDAKKGRNKMGRTKKTCLQPWWKVTMPT